MPESAIVHERRMLSNSRDILVVSPASKTIKSSPIYPRVINALCMASGRMLETSEPNKMPMHRDPRSPAFITREKTVSATLMRYRNEPAVSMRGTSGMV